MRGVIDIVGAERVPKTGPVLLVANHASRILDALIMRWAVPRKTKFVAHTDILDSLFLSTFLTKEMIIPIEDGLQAWKCSVDHCRAALDEGYAVVILPEGRAMGNGHGVYRTGAAYVAAHAQCPITPVRIQRRKMFRHRVIFGGPLPPPNGRDRVTLKAHTQVLKEQILAL